jgi:hypothetical protein
MLEKITELKKKWERAFGASKGNHELSEVQSLFFEKQKLLTSLAKEQIALETIKEKAFEHFLLKVPFSFTVSFLSTKKIHFIMSLTKKPMKLLLLG